MTRVILCDDHALIRRGIRDTLAEATDIRVIGEAAGYTDFREIEREKNKYEVKATDPQGQRVELDVDPVTGDVLKTEVKRAK